MEAKLSSWEDYAAGLLLPSRATATYLVMEPYACLQSDQTQPLLTRLRQWIDNHSELLIIWVSLVVGCWLVGKSIYLIVT